jgi:hypothetical protein
MIRRFFAAALLLSAVAAFAAEGKWTPQQMLELDPVMLKKQGLELPPSRLWDPKRGTGLLAATVNVGGCSGGFISPDGLFITNHHCLFSILQEHSTTQNDVITNGFIASSRDAELPGHSLKLTMPRSFTDVTEKIVGAVPKNATDAERNHAIERRSNELVAECEKRPQTRCKVSVFDGGVQYILVDAQEISDIRLAYAPPREIGEYGGEIDNWMWPRHTGDFAIGRAYVDGKPYKSEFYFPIATKPAKPGDFVMVLGYPGVTYHSLTAAEMAERRDLYFKRRVDMYGEWIRIWEETTKGNAEGAITIASDLKSLQNRFKNAEGQLAGFKRGSILEKQQAADQKVLAWAEKQPKHRAAVEAYNGLRAMIEEQKRTWDHDFLLGSIYATNAVPTPVGPKSLFFATTVARSAIERQKADDARDSLYMQRNIPRIAERLEREQKNYFAPSDQAIFAAIVRRALAFPAEQRIAAIDRIFGNGANVEAKIAELYSSSKIFDLAERRAMLAENPEQLHARRDPLVELGFELDPEIRTLTDRRETWEGTISRLRPVWRRAVIAHAGKPIAPDANSTLRVSFAKVRGYEPRDGVVYTPQTTVAGIVEKHTGEEPFNAPQPLLDAAKKRDDVVVDFLADADTTGGNSGSPTVNGRGELVGVNFDRVWENVANDFGYNPDVARNINVDVRYLVWLLDEVYDGKALLKEMGVTSRARASSPSARE